MASDGLAVIAFVGPMLFGTALLVALRLLPRPGGEGRPDMLREGLALVGRILIAAGCGGAINAVADQVSWFFTLPLLIVGGIVTGMAFQRWRIAHHYALLWTLTSAAERMIPLAQAAEAFARERGRFGLRARQLAALLQAGWTLPDALGQVGGPLGRDALALIRVGQQSGALAQALHEAVTMMEARQNLWGNIAARFAYLLAVPLGALLVLIFLTTKIAPAYTKIFADFGVPLPTVTEQTFAAMEAAGAYWFVWWWVPVAMAGLLLYSVLRYIGVVDWEMFGTGWVLRRIHTAAILDALALATEHARPLPEAMAALARHHPRHWVGFRLGHVLDEVSQGADWSECMVRNGLLGKTEQAVIQAAQRVGNLSWALREMAESGRRRWAYRLQAVMQTVYPAAILSYAALVAVFALGYFCPLVALIRSVSRL